MELNLLKSMEFSLKSAIKVFDKKKFIRDKNLE